MYLFSARSTFCEPGRFSADVPSAIIIPPCIPAPGFRQSIGSVRFGSARFGSVRKNNHFPDRRGSACVFPDASWLGLVRFGSVPRPVWPVPELHGSVRFGPAGSVRKVNHIILHHFLITYMLQETSFILFHTITLYSE